ncbi:MAG: ABC transporter permease [Chitinivibrionia bacterium]|nr:ABC transporter permease [Chitinivibrionia bacterium]
MKAFHIIRREYMENVRKKSFLISTILVPIMLLVITFIPIVITLFMPGSQVTIAVLDRAGGLAAGFSAALNDTLKDGRPEFVIRDFADLPAGFDEAHEALISKLEADEVGVVIDIPADVLEAGKVFYYTRDVGSVTVLEKFERRLNSIVLKKRLEHAGVDYAAVKDLIKRIDLEVHRVSKTGTVAKKELLSEWGIVFVFIMVLYMTLLTWGMSIQRSLIEEKGSRVIEVLLSSLEPKDLFIGKIVGLGAVGLTQIAVWSLTGLALGFYAFIAAARYFEYFDIAPVVLVYFIVFYILGFLFYSAIFALVGGICSTEQEAQQLQGIVTMPLIVPILIIMLIVQSPNSPLSVVLSMIPFFSPMLMLARTVILMPDAWQIALSIAILLASIYGVIYFSSRVFRVGILMYGKRPGIREIIKWSKYS